MQAGWRLVGMSAARSTNLDGLHEATDGGIVMKDGPRRSTLTSETGEPAMENAEFRQICF